MSTWRISAPKLSDEERAAVVTPDGLTGVEPSNTARDMLIGMQALPHIYPGTVDPGVVAQRRRRNKQARKSRRINRQGKR